MKEILKAYRVELDPNNKQKTQFFKNCGASRWAYNWALSQKQEAYKNGEKTPNHIELSRRLTKIKGTDELPWAYDVSKFSFQNGLKDCDQAYKNFFRGCKDGKKVGFAKFKSKHNSRQSFRLNGAIRVGENYIQLPRIGKVRIKQTGYIPDCKILSVTVSSHAGRWFASVQTKIFMKELPKNENVVGIDLGIKTLATLSDGSVFENPKTLRKYEKLLCRRHRQHSKKKKNSRNRKRSQAKLARLHYRVSCIRKDAIHKMTSKIISENQVIVLENLKVKNMMKNHNLAKSVADASFHEVRRQLEYKADWYGRTVVLADAFYPSSKLCSHCGEKHSNLQLKDRVFVCPSCGFKLDRDLNASINLMKLYTASSAGIQACGERSSPNVATRRVSRSLKQESNGKSYKLGIL